MEVTNDKSCSWINDLIPRKISPSVKNNHDCEWLVVGAGYTGDPEKEMNNPDLIKKNYNVNLINPTIIIVTASCFNCHHYLSVPVRI